MGHRTRTVLDSRLVDPEAEATLRRVVLWASWRLLGWIAAVGATTALVAWLTGGAALWWDAGAIAAARAEKVRRTSA